MPTAVTPQVQIPSQVVVPTVRGVPSAAQVGTPAAEALEPAETNEAAVTRATPAATPRAERSAPARTTAAPAPATPDATPLAAAPETTPPVDSPVLAPLPVEDSVAPPATLEQSTPGEAGSWGILAALLAALGIPVIALLTLRSRRAAKRQTVLQIERPMVARTETPPQQAVPAAAAPYVPAMDRSAPKQVFSFNTPVVSAPATSPLGATDQSTKGALPADGASIALPARMPEDFAERDALLKRMVNAKPDRANPFTDRKARLKRARLILQSLGRKFTKGSFIDLSQYPNNWPELARSKHTLQAA